MTLVSIGGKKGSRKYTGEVATGYNEKREKTQKWVEEQSIIEEMLSHYENYEDGHILDIPCGTGRFFKFYGSCGFSVVAYDISMDMLSEADKAIPHDDNWSAPIELAIGDVTAIPETDNSFDAALMCRLTRWLSPVQRTAALRELQRVTRDMIIFTARISGPHAYPYKEIESDLNGWEIAKDVGLPSDPDYRIIMLERIDGKGEIKSE